MKINVGHRDRVIRGLVGCAIFAAGFTFKSWWGVLGLYPFLTAVWCKCPLYAVLGRNTFDRTPR